MSNLVFTSPEAFARIKRGLATQPGRTVEEWLQQSCMGHLKACMQHLNRPVIVTIHHWSHDPSTVVWFVSSVLDHTRIRICLPDEEQPSYGKN